MQKPCHLIVAFDGSGGIGKNGSIPWHLPTDMRFFREMTTTTNDPKRKNAVIMGRKTYFSIPKPYRPLKNRFNIMLTKHPGKYEGETVPSCESLEDAIEKANRDDNIESIFIIGGSSVYEEAVRKQKCDRLYITKVRKKFGCDTYFCEDYENWYTIEEESEPMKEKGTSFQFFRYKRK